MRNAWIWGAVLAGAAALPAEAGLSAKQVNQARWTAPIRGGAGRNPVLVRAQVLLDRSFVSPGPIDGQYGSNLKKALITFQSLKKLPGKGVLDQATWQALTKSDKEPVLTTYTLTAADVKGPFLKKIPVSPHQKAKLKRLDYTSPVELIAERFHMEEGLLTALNPAADFKKPGTKLVVANVGGRKPEGEAKTVIVDHLTETVKAYSKDGKLLAAYPATIGSSEYPSPSGKLKVKAVAERPTFVLTSKVKYSKFKPGQKLTIPAGPNNPVGIVWIALNKHGYGIHGTPDPVKVSKTASHGCVRLTNWDALELAHLVDPGTPVVFAGGKNTTAKAKVKLQPLQVKNAAARRKGGA